MFIGSLNHKNVATFITRKQRKGEVVMTVEQLYQKAIIEWQQIINVRHQYPTFDYYWHERYERVYNFVYRSKSNKHMNLH